MPDPAISYAFAAIFGFCILALIVMALFAFTAMLREWCREETPLLDGTEEWSRMTEAFEEQRRQDIAQGMTPFGWGADE